MMKKFGISHSSIHKSMHSGHPKNVHESIHVHSKIHESMHLGKDKIVGSHSMFDDGDNYPFADWLTNFIIQSFDTKPIVNMARKLQKSTCVFFSVCYI
jgi:hypothetical protein